jgi:hypothetical protein
MYLEVAAKMRVMAAKAKSREAGVEFARLAVLYDRLAPLCAAIPKSSTWQGTSFHFDRQTVMAIAPNAPGVYALWRTDGWIYVGECHDVQRRLLAHSEGDNARIAREAPKGFGFELIPKLDQRVARLEALIRELAPICNLLPG